MTRYLSPMRRRVPGVLPAALAMAASLLAAPGFAQNYPTKPVKLVIPYVAGSSSNDIIGRAIATRMTALLGQQMIVENRPGSAGNVGGEYVVKSAPDGYTLLLGINGPMAIAPSVYPDLPFDTTRDLAAVALIAKVPYLLAVHPSVPAKNVKELVALAKSKELSFGTTGSGGTPHLCVELFMAATGIKMLHVPYKGGAQTVTDLIGGQINMYCAGFSAMTPQIRANKVRAIASATVKRSDLLPDLPTFVEQGIPDFEVASWIGINAPAKTPQPIIKTLYDNVAKMMAAADMKAYLLSQGAEASLMNPNEYAAYLKTEIAKWGKIVKVANIKPE